MKYGQLPWSTVMAPAIQLARYGFKVTEDTVSYIKAGIAGLPNFLVEDPNWAIDFAPNGTLVKLGDTMTRKRYADTLGTSNCIRNSLSDPFSTPVWYFLQILL